MANKGWTAQVREAVSWILILLALMWGIEILNMLSGHALSRMAGIHPRSLVGLIGIPLSPFLHFGLYHLIANTLPFAVLGALVFMHGRKRFIQVSVFVVVVSGLGVWLLARSAVHAGASGLIFGYFGYLLAAGWYARSLQTILIALFALFIYGGMVFGMMPVRSYISWESHLFGFLAGILAARLFDKKAARKS